MESVVREVPTRDAVTGTPRGWVIMMGPDLEAYTLLLRGLEACQKKGLDPVSKGQVAPRKPQ